VRTNHYDTMKMYVGNLPFDINEQDLRSLFAEHGVVTDVHLPIDRDSGRPRGFAFVTMDSKGAMVNAIKALDGQEFQGRNLKVNEARAREDRGGGGGGGGGGGNRGGGGGGGNRGGGGRRW
jgi:cold-inducible RNA-binding protein